MNIHTLQCSFEPPMTDERTNALIKELLEKGIKFTRIEIAYDIENDDAVKTLSAILEKYCQPRIEV